MKKPDELLELLDTLRESGDESTVTAFNKDAHAIVYIGRNELTLPMRDCLLLLSTEESVEEFFAAIGSPTDARISLFDLDIDETVKSALEEQFSDVDEQ